MAAIKVDVYLKDGATVTASMEFACISGEPNREFAQALRGDRSETLFGHGTAKRLYEIYSAMYPGCEFSVTIIENRATDIRD